MWCTNKGSETDTADKIRKGKFSLDGICFGESIRKAFSIFMFLTFDFFCIRIKTQRRIAATESTTFSILI